MKIIRTIIDNLIALICAIYAFIILVLLLFKNLLYDLDPLFALLYTFAPYWFAPIVVLLPIGLLFRTRAAILSLVVVSILFASQYGALFTPNFPQNQSGATLKLITFNLGPGRARKRVSL